jgi:predicted amidophosphoribosyltransferase
MLAKALALLAPPLCGTCGDPCGATEAICAACARLLAAAPGGTADAPGVGRVTWAAPYEGIARDLVTALKFGGRLQLAEIAAEAIGTTLDRSHFAAVVPIPPAPSRLRHRGFDPAELIAAALARRLAVPVVQPLRRTDGPRQVGRRRRERLAAPPRMRAVAPAPARALLVDDVLTTGATLAAGATSLRGAGAGEIQAAVFARALGDRPVAA